MHYKKTKPNILNHCQPAAQPNTMKFLVALSVAVACVVADVSHIVKEDYSAPILKSDYEITPEGAFQYAYETGNGIAAQVQGVIKNPNQEYPTLTIQGTYKYFNPDGSPVEISYLADENGYHASGSAIPTPHPVPEYIARSIAYIQSHPPQESPVKLGKAAILG